MAILHTMYVYVMHTHTPICWLKCWKRYSLLSTLLNHTIEWVHALANRRGLCVVHTNKFAHSIKIQRAALWQHTNTHRMLSLLGISSPARTAKGPAQTKSFFHIFALASRLMLLAAIQEIGFPDMSALTLIKHLAGWGGGGIWGW